MPAFENTSVIEWLRRIQLDWALTPEKMALLTFVPEATLKHYFELNPIEANELPSIPPGLEGAVVLVSIYKKLKIKHADAEEQLKWLFTEHKDFGDAKPIDVMSQSQESLSWVSYYLGN